MSRLRLPDPVLPRWLLFGVAMASMVLLTYAGVLFAFSVPVTEEISGGDPALPPGMRAVVVPLGEASSVRVMNESSEADRLVWGDAGTFPATTRETRIGRAALYVPPGANGTAVVGNATLDLATFSGGEEGWVVQPVAGEPWFSARDITVGKVARTVTPQAITALFVSGAIGFVAPLVVIVLTHRGGASSVAGALGAPPTAFCRECRAPMAAATDFCTRCGAWSAKEGPR